MNRKGVLQVEVYRVICSCQVTLSSEECGRLTCKIVKFSSTLFIMYFSGRCFSLWMKLIMYSHMGERWILYTNRPFSKRAYSVSTFSTTCLPKEQTLVEHVMVMFSGLSYLQGKKKWGCNDNSKKTLGSYFKGTYCNAV